ncbi:MAG: hypothetical protein Q9211_001201 [Gyalolechia sp. 1 TL-2023]
MSSPRTGYHRSSNITSSDDKSRYAALEVSEQLSSSTSSTANQSSTSSSASRRSSGGPKKRKRSINQVIGVRASRKKRYYSAKYHSLFNKTIRDLQAETHGPADKGDPKTSQIGISTWSPQERDRLFRGVARYGGDDFSAIAVLIGTKTELEVHSYLQVLREASTRQHKYGARRSLIGMADIAAAVEISNPCCASLEQAADAMAALQQRVEEQQEKQKHADLWRLDHKVAQWVDRGLSEGDEGRIEVFRKLPAAEILNLRHFLKLSTNVFMNSDEPHSNYRSYVSRSEKPSMLHTAFADLHTVALSVTKRLIQSSLFFAMSRLRATRSSRYVHQRAVKQADVLAALKVLGMKDNSRDYWVHVPRRCKLNVHDQKNARDSRAALDYNEVERALAFAKPVVGKKFDPADPSEDHNTVPRSLEEFSSEAESQCIQSSSMDVDRPENPSAQSSEETDLSAPGERFGQRTDAYLEHIDQKASEKEELRLWKMLNGSPPPDVSVQESSVKFRNPGPCRKAKDDLDDWRGWVNFRPEWETYDINSLDEALAEHRKQRRTRSRKIARRDVQRRQGQSEHKAGTPQTLGQSDNAPVDTTPAGHQRSTSLGATYINERSADAIGPADEENCDAIDDYPDDEYAQELEGDFENAVDDHHNSSPLSEEEVQISRDDRSRPAGRRRHGSAHGDMSSSEDEEESESGRDGGNVKHLDPSTEEYSDSSGVDDSGSAED